MIFFKRPYKVVDLDLYCLLRLQFLTGTTILNDSLFTEFVKVFIKLYTCHLIKINETEQKPEAEKLKRRQMKEKAQSNGRN